MHKKMPKQTISIKGFILLFVFNCIILASSVVGSYKGIIDTLISTIIIIFSILSLILLCTEAADDTK